MGRFHYNQTAAGKNLFHIFFLFQSKKLRFFSRLKGYCTPNLARLVHSALFQNHQHLCEKSNKCAFCSKLPKELKIGIEILVGQSAFLSYGTKQPNVALIHNLRNTLPAQILHFFGFSWIIYYEMHILFSKRC